ncbi:glycosyl hydrolase [Dysgonomonas sp. 520]|uniref:glycosyl hydrolase n=1 Tax=Dysgonomonas sp. 520 TaxID=2302931 RepID=UPI0013D171E8|nr:glycosyl hydrolase [Dysgonomonas sp. 520]NDW09745.1 T9SS C-terminal target domain-containing protein [Dysgonomonas sp. 520]
MKRLHFLTLSILTILIPMQNFAQQKSYKRGVSYNIPYDQDIAALSDGISWFYNWDSTPKNSTNNAIEENGIDFLPMAWNGDYNEAAIRNYLKTHPNVKYLLGFNEPNFVNQANMTPKQAAAKWKDLEKIADNFGLKLVGPAVNYSPDAPYYDPINYLDDFFKECPNCRVDYIAVHCYMPYPSALMWYIGRFKKYGKPIWLTEFCAWDNFWEIEGNPEENQLEYMVNALNYLENDKDVYRYAWFIPRTDENDKWPFMQLLEDNKPGKLTKLGEVFVNMSSQDKSHYFNVSSQIPAEHYTSTNIADIPDSDHWESSILLEPTNDQSGKLNICDFRDNRWVEYNINVPENAGDCKLQLRVSCESDAICKVSVDGNEKPDLTIKSTNEFSNWQTQEYPFSITPGKHTIRLKITSGNIKLNWLNLLSPNHSSISKNKIADISIYPNPATDILNISGEQTPTLVTVYNPQGKKLISKPKTKELDINNLVSGMYFVKIDIEDGSNKTLSLLKK